MTTIQGCGRGPCNVACGRPPTGLARMTCNFDWLVALRLRMGKFVTDSFGELLELR